MSIASIRNQTGAGLTKSKFLFQRLLQLFLLLSALLVPGAAMAQGVSAAQYKLEAVFLFNFTQFIDWPASSFANAEAPFTIGVLGKDPFGPVLDEIVRGETVKGRKLHIERYATLKEVKNCQILYISQSEESRVAQILSSLKGKPVLTVSDSENFARQGGAIRFLTGQPKIRLRINVDALAKSHLTASSKLLRLAEIVHSR